MLVLLPPSENKTACETGPILDFDSLLFPDLGTQRRSVARTLTDVSARPDGPQILGLGPKSAGEVQLNLDLLRSPCQPAWQLYTGVLYQALEPATLTDSQLSQVWISSALFGMVRANDWIPNHRLSMGVKLPGFGPLATWWKKQLPTSILDGNDVFDARSQVYQKSFPVAGALSLRVQQQQADGTQKVISHFAKHWRGLVARALLQNAGQNAADVIAAIPSVQELTRDKNVLTITVG